MILEAVTSGEGLMFVVTWWVISYGRSVCEWQVSIYRRVKTPGVTLLSNNLLSR
jgi:hypothetical protein